MLLNKARRDIAWAGLNANAKLLLDRSEWVGPTFIAASRNQEDMKQCAAHNGVRRRATRATPSMRRRRCSRVLSLVRAHTVPTVPLVNAALPHLANGSLDMLVLAPG